MTTVIRDFLICYGFLGCRPPADRRTRPSQFDILANYPKLWALPKYLAARKTFYADAEKILLPWRLPSNAWLDGVPAAG